MDPNKTVIGAPQGVPPIPGGDPNRTVLDAPPLPGGAMPGAVPNATTRMAPMVPGSSNGPGASAGPALTVDIVPGRTATMANGPAREAFLLQLHAGAGADASFGGFTPAGSRTATNVCLVIDRSGSMEGPPLEAVKNACAYVVDMLGPNDTLSIVTFAENVEVLMPPQRVTQKDPIKRGIANLQAGNTTDFHGGITLGLQQLTQGVEGRRASRMIVLTDGDPTAGITEFAPITALATQVKNAGASLTLLGFGPDYNEELLAGMAKRASGNYYYIATADMLTEVFRAEMAKTLTAAAQGITLDVKLSRWVGLRSPQTLNEGTATISIPDLERGATVEQVLEFEFPNHPLGQYRVAALQVRDRDRRGPLVQR
ncbi:VWA domain-containing protein, partial [bacterium]